MTDNEFKKHLYKQLEADEKNKGVLTNQLYPTPKKKTANKYSNEKHNQKNSS
jgi:hypothetical protein